MKKTVSINLNGLVFYIDEDAFLRLRTYLDKLEKWYRGEEGAQEIISDIEDRIAELFEEKVKPGIGVITMPMVEEVINIMGEPEEFEDLSGENTVDDKSSTYRPPKRLYRDIDDRVFGGVCSGIAAYFNIDTVLVRVIFGILPFVSVGVIIPIYIVLWIAVPPAVTTAQKLQMRGEPINISNIERMIKEEYEDMKKQFGKIKDTKTYKKGKNFFKNMGKGDKTVLLVILGILAAALLFGHGMPHNMLAFNFIAPVGLVPVHHAGTYLSHIFFPGIVPLLLVLALLAILIKPLLKVILYVIAILLIGTLVLKALFWLFGTIVIIA